MNTADREDLIKDYNQYLVDKYNSMIPLDNYFNYIHTQYYNNIDISFMEYFVYLCKNGETFCITHDKLIEFGIYVHSTKI